jgi:uncharacterized membrane protein (DUF2068 family)
MDWNLFGCARKGHVTYTPDEPELRNRLVVSAPAGTARRCLRCGAFVTSGEHGGGPAAAAPLIRRGAELRSELILRVFAVERFLRFLVIGAAAYGVWRFKYDRGGFQRVYDNALPAIRALYQDLGFDVSRSRLLSLINESFAFDSRWLTLLAIGLALYALIELVESAGLWQGRRWGEYFAMVATSIFLPLEVWDLTRGHITWLKVGALVINLLLVIYLVWTRRLFGVRGGKVAYDARLRSESVIEVEQAALAAAGQRFEPAHRLPGQVRRRSLYHRGAVLFIGQPRPAVSAGSTVSISQPAKAVSTSSCDAPPTSDRHRLGPKLSSSNVAPGLASAETPPPWDRRCPASRPWKQPTSRKKWNVPSPADGSRVTSPTT